MSRLRAAYAFCDFQIILSPAEHRYPQSHSEVRGQALVSAFRSFCTELSHSWIKYPRSFCQPLFPNPLTGLWLKDAPSAYSFCNLDLHRLTPTVNGTALGRVFGPRRAS